MLMYEPTKEMIEEWKAIFDQVRGTLRPNRKSGEEVDRYFREIYPWKEYTSPEFRQMLKTGILENEHTIKKLHGLRPDIRTYLVEDVLIGIDLISGEFHVESEDFDRMQEIYDDLFAFRGLDEEDLENFFLVAQYVKLHPDQFNSFVFTER